MSSYKVKLKIIILPSYNYFYNISGENRVTHSIVAIHIRQGDFSEMATDAYLRYPAKDYFIQAMGYFREKYNYKVKFLIASDALPWCKNQNEFQASDVYFTKEANSANLDFAIISSCDDMIISRGYYYYYYIIMQIYIYIYICIYYSV